MMRVEEVLTLRTKYRSVIEPLSARKWPKEGTARLRLLPRDSLKRVALNRTGLSALRLMQPLVRRIGRVDIPFRYELLAYGERFTHAALFRQFFRSVADPGRLSVLVQGCAQADYAVQKWLRYGVASVTGIDIENLDEFWADLVPQLRSAYGGEVCLRQASVEALPFEDARFDVINSAAVYEHVYNLDAAARESARVLKPGGRALHEIGPLYYTHGGDHCIGVYGLEAGYDHLLLADEQYRARVLDDAYFGASADPCCNAWAVRDKLSFAPAAEYLDTFRKYFDIEFLLAKISPEGVRFRARYPQPWGRLLAAGMSPADLLVKGLGIILKKR
jgi:SAM-dependent methyltransferase